MNLRLLLLAPGFGLLGLVAACGDSSPAATPTAARSAAPASQATPATGATPELGPAPPLGGNVVKVSPAHATQVKQAATRSPDPGRPQNGVCFEVSFENTPEYGQWFRMALDGKEVTQDLTWILPSQNAPTRGTACYAPPNGLAVGRHEAAVSVQNPRSPTEKPRQTIGWRFDVTQ